MFKLNFNGVAKGNSGPTGMGGVFRNAVGNILAMYWGFIGENTNNVVELKALLAGLNMAMTHGWFLVIIEGDSQIILQMATKLLHGKLVNRVAENWHMAYNLEQLKSILLDHFEVHIRHVKRKANQLADTLANHGVHTGQELH